MVAAELERSYGVEVRLVRMGLEKSYIPFFKPHLVLYNNMYGDHRAKATAWLAKSGIRSGVLPTEGITFSEEQNHLFACKWCDLSHVDLYLSWNRRIKEAMVELGTLDAEKIAVVGCSRFDMYSTAFRHLLKPKAELIESHGLNPEWPVVVWATNYVHSTFLDKNRAFYLEDAKRLGSDNVSALKGMKAAEFDAEDKRRTLASVRHFLSEAERINFILKPHPSEAPEDYAAFGTDYDDAKVCVRVVHGEYMWDVLNGTDVLMQRLSTTAIEAWMFGVDTIELLPMESYDDFFLNPLYSQGSLVASDGASLSEHVGAILNGEGSTEAMRAFREESIEYLCHKVDGASHNRIAAAIHAFVSSLESEPRIRYDLRMIRWALEAAVKRAFGLPRNLTMKEIVNTRLLRRPLADYLGRFDKMVSDEAIAAWLDHWRKAEGSSGRLD